MDSITGRAGIVTADEDDSSMDKLAHSVLDDMLYNVIADLLMKTHREEKMAKAATAAICVEKLAKDAADGSAPDTRPDIRVETKSALYEDGRVLLKGNPLQTVGEIVCPKCQLPRLLHPTDGKGSQKPDPAGIYCKKHPYIDKPGCDIYGQSWVAPGPGRGKKKKDVEKKEDGAPEQRPTNVLSFPSATCIKCKRCILVTRLNNHMGSCIGNSGRTASRAAAQKINGNSQNESTPPSSQKATPVPASRAASPRKREASEDEAGDSDTGHQKKKQKSAANISLTKRVILKTKPPLKKDRIKGNSQLSQEHRAGSGLAAAVPTGKGPRASNKNGSPVKKMKASKLLQSSPVSKNVREVDGVSEMSELLSSPQGK
ncbi:hypothetical protein E4U59_001214 [Claviceps monticola]|nr:hypothetical protein E4U59_001214 [Claviceps monticola]